MRKIFAILLALLLIMGMAIPVLAVTPSMKVPDVPDVSQIKFNFKFELPDNYWNNWFGRYPIKINLY